MDELCNPPTNTNLTQSNEKGSVNKDQPFENLVELRGNLARFASRKGLPSRVLSQNMREILSLKLPLVRSPSLK